MIIVEAEPRHEPSRVRSRHGFVPSGVLVLFAADLLMGLAAVIAYAVTRTMDVDKAWFFRLGQENNLPTWYSSSQLLLVALLLGALAWRDLRRQGWRAWPLAAATLGFLGLSLDETASMHEWIGQMAQGIVHTDGGLRTGIWFLVCAPIFLIGAGGVAAGMWPYLRGRPKVWGLLLVGMSVFLINAVGLEALSNLWPDGSVIVKAETFFEEVGEMLGVTFMFWSAWELLKVEGIALHVD